MPLAKRIDTLASKKERELTPEEDASIRRQLDEAYNAIALAEKKYIEKGTPLDHSLIEALKGTLTPADTPLPKPKAKPSPTP